MFAKSIIATALIAVSSVASARIIELPDNVTDITVNTKGYVDFWVKKEGEDSGTYHSSHYVYGDVTFKTQEEIGFRDVGEREFIITNEIKVDGIKTQEELDSAKRHESDAGWGENGYIMGSNIPTAEMKKDVDGLKDSVKDLDNEVKKNSNDIKDVHNYHTGENVAMQNDIRNNTQAINTVTNRVDQMESRINKVESDIDVLKSGVAMSMAMGALPQAYSVGETVIGAGMGNFEGSNAVAVGVSHRMESVTVNFNFSSTGTETGAAIGVGYSF